MKPIKLIKSKNPALLEPKRKVSTPYELFKNKKGEWEWRKRGRNKLILNHRYNTKAAAIKGMKADYAVTVKMNEFNYKQID